MANGLPKRAEVGVPGRTVSIATDTYFLAKRMEQTGILRPGQALMLSATLQKPQSGKMKGRRK